MPQVPAQSALLQEGHAEYKGRVSSFTTPRLFGHVLYQQANTCTVKGSGPPFLAPPAQGGEVVVAPTGPNCSSETAKKLLFHGYAVIYTTHYFAGLVPQLQNLKRPSSALSVQEDLADLTAKPQHVSCSELGRAYHKMSCLVGRQECSTYEGFSMNCTAMKGT